MNVQLAIRVAIADDKSPIRKSWSL